MQRRYRLRRSSDFAQARTKGRAWRHPLLGGFFYERADAAPARVGIVVGKRTGKAVVRNRVKRRIREAARGLYALLSPGYDIVVIARPEAADATVQQLIDALGAIFGRAGARLPLASVREKGSA